MKKGILLLLTCAFLFCLALPRTEPANAAISTISVSPSTITVDQPGMTFNVTFRLTNAPNMTQFIVNNITWNPAIIELATGSDNDFIEGPLLKSFGSTVFMTSYPSASDGIIDEVTCALLTTYVTPGSSGDIFTITFRSKIVGTTSIDIGYGILLRDLDIADEPTLQGGTVNVVPEFSPIVLLMLLLSATVVALTAKNLGRKRQKTINLP
jgi:hypothetical protein